MIQLTEIRPQELYRVHGEVPWEKPSWFVECQPDGLWSAFSSPNPKKYHSDITWSSRGHKSQEEAISTLVTYKRREDQRARNRGKGAQTYAP